MSVRIWPARFSEHKASDEAQDYSGCYLIGLSRYSTIPNTDKNQKALSKQALEHVLTRFQDQLQADDKHYDPTTSYLSVSLANQSDVKRLQLDDRQWGHDFDAELDPDSDDEMEPGDTDDAPATYTLPVRITAKPVPVSTNKLRPASDVLNRLRWDPSLNPSDFIIGYEDRFLGAQEIGLEKWKSEQTDEEFIPQHRILYFKRRNEGDKAGEVVWERATRIDRVFGSGVGARNVDSDRDEPPGLLR